MENLRDKDFYIGRTEKALEGLCYLLKTASLSVDRLSEDEMFGIGEIVEMIKEELEKASGSQRGGMMKNFSEDNCKSMSAHLYRAECALEGLAALMREAQNFDILKRNEMNGISELIMLVRGEVLKIKQVIDNPALISELESFFFTRLVF